MGVLLGYASSPARRRTGPNTKFRMDQTMPVADLDPSTCAGTTQARASRSTVHECGPSDRASRGEDIFPRCFAWPMCSLCAQAPRGAQELAGSCRGGPAAVLVWFTYDWEASRCGFGLIWTPCLTQLEPLYSCQSILWHKDLYAVSGSIKRGIESQRGKGGSDRRSLQN